MELRSAMRLPPSRHVACRAAAVRLAPRAAGGVSTSISVSQSQSQFIKDKRLHVNTRNIQRQLYPCTATEEVD